MNVFSNSCNGRENRLFPSIMLLAGLILFGAEAAQGAPDKARLIIDDCKGAILLERELNPACGFAVRYTHSVARTPVTDYFLPGEGGVVLDRTVYSDFGAGLPTAPEEGQKMTWQDGRLEISGFNRTLGKFALRLGRIAKHRLVLLDGEECGKETEIGFSSLIDPGAEVCIGTETGGTAPRQ